LSSSTGLTGLHTNGPRETYALSGQIHATRAQAPDEIAFLERLKIMGDARL
jgi:hypothetical protein